MWNLSKGRTSYTAPLESEADWVGFLQSGEAYSLISGNRITVHSTSGALLAAYSAPRRILCCASQDDSLVLLGLEDGSVRVWDVRTSGVVEGWERAHPNRVRGLAILQAGTLLGSISLNISTWLTYGTSLGGWVVDGFLRTIKPVPHPQKPSSGSTILTRCWRQPLPLRRHMDQPLPIWLGGVMVWHKTGAVCQYGNVGNSIHGIPLRPQFICNEMQCKDAYSEPDRLPASPDTRSMLLPDEGEVTCGLGLTV